LIRERVNISKNLKIQENLKKLQKRLV